MTRTRALLLTLLALPACGREYRDYRPEAPFAEGMRLGEDYERNAYDLAEGKRLFRAMNCNGCHGQGGGGIGPPLMDDDWLYGDDPAVVFDSISRGRPNGMPAFGGAAREPGITVVGALPDYQRWQLAAYVRSLAGLVPGTAAPGRGDHMSGPPAEQNRPPEPPRVVSPDASRADRLPQLAGYGWADKGAGVARIPIGGAMEAVVETERAKAGAKKGGPQWRP